MVVLDHLDPVDRSCLMGAIQRAITAPAPIDVFVTDAAEFERRKDVLGSMQYWPAREGELVYDVPPDHSQEAWRWLDQSVEDLRTARRLAADPEGPPRLAAFLPHLAAEKALKGVFITRGVATKTHDLVALQLALPPEDAAAVSSDDIDLLNPWNIESRYPADLGDADPSVAAATLARPTGSSLRSAAACCVWSRSDRRLVTRRPRPHPREDEVMDIVARGWCQRST